MIPCSDFIFVDLDMWLDENGRHIILGKFAQEYYVRAHDLLTTV